jgi:predicted chitinase/LysM repeat protein
MDPEVIAQLEEQLRMMNELLAQQNSMMAAQMGAMKTAGGKLNAAAGGFAKGMGANEQANTKYAEAQAKAAESSEKWDKAARASQMTLTAFSAAVSSTSNVLGSLGGALLSAEKGFSKYGGTVDAAASAAQGLASSLPIVGQALGAIVGVAGQIASKVVGDALKLTDAIVNLRDETVKTAGALPTSSEGLLKLANDAKYFGENIQTLGKITQGLGTGLITLGKTAGDGAVKFMELANVSEETRQAFGKMGISQEQLTEMQATYIKQQQSSGLAYLSQNKSIDQLRKESLKYAENLNALSSLTGKQADALRAEQDIAAAVMQEKIAQRQDLVELKRLRDNKQFAEAAELEAKMKSMADYRDTMSNLVGPEQTALYMNYMRTGVYNNISAPLAVLGADLDTARTQLQRGADGMKVAAQSADDLTAKQSQMSTNLGQAALHMDEQSLASTGLLKDSIGRLNDTFGQSAEERLAAAKKNQEERKAGSPMDDAIEKARSAERALQQKYQEFLIDGIKKAAALLNATDLNKLAADAMRYGLIALKAGLAVATVATGVLAAAKWKEWRASVAAKEAQKDFTKALRESAAAMKQQTSASRNAARADTAEARASGSAASADRSESTASNRARAADIAEARASGSAASADRTEAAASRRAASADMREAAASQRAATADMREAAASMKAAAADLREAKASDAAARADMRESMSGGGGFGGGGGKGGKLLRFAKGAAGGLAGLLGGMALDYGSEKAEEAGHTKTAGALSVGSSAVTGAGTGAMIGSVIPGLGTAAGAAIGGVLGGLYGLYQNSDKLFGTGKPNSPTTETAEAAEKLTSAAESLEESNKETIANSLAILNSASSVGGVEKMTPEQLAAYGITPEVAPVVAQEPGTSEKEKAAQAGYTIQKGDTLSKLAEQYGTTVEALMEANKQITNKDLIYEGAQLNIPGQENLNNEYKVKKGDTLRKIAEQYGMSHEDLLKANPNLKNKDWKEGYKLNIPGMAGMPGTGLTPQELAMQQNEDMITDQIDQNRKLFGEPLQQSQEEREKQAQSFTDLNNSMGLFKKNIDSTNKAFIDLMSASDELFKALTGRDRPGSENAPAGPGGTSQSYNAAIPENVRGNLDKISQSLKNAGFTDQNYINAVLGNVMKESGGNFNIEEDIAGYANTDNSRIRNIFKTKSKGMSDAEITALKADPKAFANKMYGDRGGNNKPGDGWLFRGRGPIGLTGRANYSKASRDIYGDDRLVENPDLVMDPEVGSQVVVWFMKQNEGQMRSKLGFSKDQALNQQDAALLATSQIAGQKITRGKGFLGTEALGKVESYASAISSNSNSVIGAVSDFGRAVKDATGAMPGGAMPGLPPAASSGSIVPLGRALQGMKLRVDENIHFDGKHPAPGSHSKTGGHYDGTAIDVNAPGGIVEANDPKWGPMFDQLARAGAAAGYHTLWKSPDGKHHNHIHFQYSGSMGRNSKIGAERGGILKGPDSGYPVELHGTEMVVPLDNRFTRSMNKSSEQYTVNGKPVDKKAYDSFMKSNPELQNIQQKVQSMLGTISNDKLDPAKMISSMSRLMDNNLTGVKDEMIDKNKKIQDSLIQLVSKETNKALQAINETNQPMQNAATSITNSMQTVMKAHTSTMNELNYRLGQMVDALETSNDVTKKILKKASA